MSETDSKTIERVFPGRTIVACGHRCSPEARKRFFSSFLTAGSRTTGGLVDLTADSISAAAVEAAV